MKIVFQKLDNSDKKLQRAFYCPQNKVELTCNKYKSRSNRYGHPNNKAEL